MTRQDGWRTGCYLVEFTPATPRARTDFGTLRVESVGHGFHTSADLYHAVVSPRRRSTRSRPNQGIPQFPLRNYRFYLRGDAFPTAAPAAEPAPEPPGLEWAFTVFEFAPEAEHGPFIQRQQYLARLHPAARGSAQTASRSNQKLRGPVVNQTGEVVGELIVHWRTSAFRGLTGDLQSLDGAPLFRPEAQGSADSDWSALLAAHQLQGHLSVREARKPTHRPPERKRPWPLAELDRRVLSPRPPRASHPAVPRFRCFSVESLEGGLIGVAIDHAVLETNRGLPPTLTWVIPTGARKAPRATVAGGAERGFAGPALQALGRALGIRPEIDPLAPQLPRGMGEPRRATLKPRQGWARPWPETLGAAERHELRHAPEIALRAPGALSTHGHLQVRHLLGFPPGTTGALDDVALTLTPTEATVPLGAPVRVRWTLRNHGELAVQLPVSLEFSSGHLSGEVRPTSASGVGRGFRPWLVIVTHGTTRVLEPGEATTGQLLLLRGPDGALFPRPGVWEIRLVLEWRRGIRLVRFEATAAVTVTRPASAADARLARRVLAEPELQPALELPGRPWTSARRCLAEVARHLGPLRDAFAAVEAWHALELFRPFTPSASTPKRLPPHG